MDTEDDHRTQSTHAEARLRVANYFKMLDAFYGDEVAYDCDDVVDYATGDPGSAPLLASDLRLLSAPATDWTPIDAPGFPPESVELQVITPAGEERVLVYRKGLWWLPDGSMYVYFVPAFWRVAP